MGAGAGKLEVRWTSGKLATLFGVSANSIKNWSDQWERDGSMPPVPRTPGNHRIYDQRHVDVFMSKLPVVSAPVAPADAPASGG